MAGAVISTGITYCKDRWEDCDYFNIVFKIFSYTCFIGDKIIFGSKSLNQCGSRWIPVIKKSKPRLEKLCFAKF